MPSTQLQIVFIHVIFMSFTQVSPIAKNGMYILSLIMQTKHKYVRSKNIFGTTFGNSESSPMEQVHFCSLDYITQVELWHCSNIVIWHDTSRSQVVQIFLKNMTY